MVRYTDRRNERTFVTCYSAPAEQPIIMDNTVLPHGTRLVSIVVRQRPLYSAYCCPGVDEAEIAMKVRKAFLDGDNNYVSTMEMKDWYFLGEPSQIRHQKRNSWRDELSPGPSRLEIGVNQEDSSVIIASRTD